MKKIWSKSIQLFGGGVFLGQNHQQPGRETDYMLEVLRRLTDPGIPRAVITTELDQLERV